MTDERSEPTGPTVYVPPEQRDEFLRMINANRRACGLLPQLYPGHDPYADSDTTAIDGSPTTDGEATRG